ncbi:ABC transporter ATP-binding protein [Canibacter zhoujuaniae]|uniref:ABC transporter ATP-binding protein n=1 Tax=Canibacter zhoujuaniae TaxID=2708343 RepID=UPI00141F57A2|nr:ABC transporter ATP-binding protein [Canibacter zhoujuaniae]
MKDNIIELHVKSKLYRGKSSVVTALNDLTLAVSQAQTLAIVGESGIGKSTLLNILGLLDRKFIGSYSLFGKDVFRLTDAELAQWRNQKIGFVLQESALINSLSIADNIALPMLYAKQRKSEGRKRLLELTRSLGIESILDKKPLECSGGEKARAIFARAVILKPQLILADEPTASLDAENAERILDLLLELNKHHGATVITVTHDSEIASRHERLVELKRG